MLSLLPFFYYTMDEEGERAIERIFWIWLRQHNAKEMDSILELMDFIIIYYNNNNRMLMAVKMGTDIFSGNIILTVIKCKSFSA